MEIKRQTVETTTPCPRCGELMHLRQWKPVFPEGGETEWRDEGKVCFHGCQLTAGEMQQ